MGEIAKECSGGRANLAQAGRRDPSKLADALTDAQQQLLAQLK